jgi:hypothetical protein
LRPINASFAGGAVNLELGTFTLEKDKDSSASIIYERAVIAVGRILALPDGRLLPFPLAIPGTLVTEE